MTSYGAEGRLAWVTVQSYSRLMRQGACSPMSYSSDLRDETRGSGGFFLQH